MEGPMLQLKVRIDLLLFFFFSFFSDIVAFIDIVLYFLRRFHPIVF